MTFCPALSNYARKLLPINLQMCILSQTVLLNLFEFFLPTKYQEVSCHWRRLRSKRYLISFFFFSALKFCMQMLPPHHVPCLWTQIISLVTWPDTFELPDSLSIIHISAFVLRAQQLNVFDNFSKASPIIWSFHSAGFSRKSFWEQYFLKSCTFKIMCLLP